MLRVVAFAAAVILLWMAQSAGSYAVDEWTVALIAAKPPDADLSPGSVHETSSARAGRGFAITAAMAGAALILSFAAARGRILRRILRATGLWIVAAALGLAAARFVAAPPGPRTIDPAAGWLTPPP